jgi:hypothetical protein
MAQPDPMEVHEVQPSIARSLELIAGELAKIAKSLQAHNQQKEVQAALKAVKSQPKK